MAALQFRIGVTDAKLGAALGVLALATLVGQRATPPLLSRYRGQGIVAAVTGLALAMAVLAGASDYRLMLGGLVMLGLSFGILDVGLNVAALTVEKTARRLERRRVVLWLAGLGLTGVAVLTVWELVLLRQAHVNSEKHDGRTIEELRAEISQKTGENVVIRRFSRFQPASEQNRIGDLWPDRAPVGDRRYGQGGFEPAGSRRYEHIHAEASAMRPPCAETGAASGAVKRYARAKSTALMANIAAPAAT